MENRKKLTIDMTREGEFVDPPQGSRPFQGSRPSQGSWPPRGPQFQPQFAGSNLPLAERIGRAAIVVAVLAGLLGAAALALWFALALIPVVLAASAVAWVAYRVQLWRIRR